MQRVFAVAALLAVVGALAISSEAFVFPINYNNNSNDVTDLEQFSAWDPLPANYQTLKASEKQQLLWELVKKSEYATLPAWTGQGWAEFLAKLKVFWDLSPSLDTVSDIMPENRPKAIHSFGVIGKIEFKPNAGASKFTGLFQSGAVGVARFSLAADPKSTGNLPGVAVKLLIDGLPSTNFVANWDLDGQGPNADFFAAPVRTWLPNPNGVLTKLIAAIFARTEPDPGTLPVRGLSLYDNTGKAASSPSAPNMLLLAPDERLKKLIPSTSTVDVRSLLLSKVEPGPLYHVYKQDSLTDPNPVYIGDLNLVEKLSASSFGDEKLFFQHQRKKPKQ